MKRHFLGMMMLALGAAGVVWIAVEQESGKRAETPAVTPTPTPTPAPTPTPTPTPAPEEEPPEVDAGDVDARHVADSGSEQVFPPLAAYAAWSVVRWNMSAADVSSALEASGVDVAPDANTRDRRLRAKRGPWEATIELGASGVDRIVVTGSELSREAAEAAVAKAKERAPATKTIARSERRWKKDGGASASLVTHADGAAATMREEHVRERSPGGAIGFAGLRWGMSTQEVVGQLTPAGYVAHVLKAPAAGAGQKSHADTVPFTKGDVEGTASFNQFGLRHAEISGPTVDGGAARAKELESALGKPASFEMSTKTEHVDHARMTWIDVEVIERRPGSGLTVVETYRPNAGR